MLPSNRNRSMPRGQALVLFSFTLLLLVLMVTMTLSFGTKAKEKMEVQMVADNAAYSVAVDTARVYNLLAVNNRVMIAHMVAMLGVHSAASFASLTVGITWGLFVHMILFELPNQASQCSLPWGPYCGCWGFFAVLFGRVIPLWFEYQAVFGLIASVDILVGNQANNNSLATFGLYILSAAGYALYYFTDMENQAIPKRIASQAASIYPGEWGAESGGDTVAKKETGILPFLDGAINVSNLLLTGRHAVIMAMASRGHPFTAGRGGIFGFSLAGTTETLAQYMRTIVGNDIAFFTNSGNAYFGNEAHDNFLPLASAGRAIADDHMFIIAQYSGPGCTGVFLPLLFQPVAVLWTRAVYAEGFHQAGSGIQIPQPFPGTFGYLPYIPLFLPYFDANHYQSGACLLDCPSAWTNFTDVNYNPFLYKEGNNWNQPKLPVTVRRNMRARSGGADPWNLAFNYRFNPSSAGTTFDTKNGNGIVLRDGTDISLQTGFATGITYFHRAQHLKEPPNLFSPFWRAGLTRGDVDDGSVAGGDIERTLNGSNVPWAANTFRELWNVGFRGRP